MKLKFTLAGIMFIALALAAQSQVPTPRYGHSVCKIDGMYYIYGGYIIGNKKSTNSVFSADVYEYNPDNLTFTKKVTPVAAPNIALHNALTHNGKMIVLGGTRADGVGFCVNTYDPTNNSWQQDATQPFTTRNRMAGDTISGEVYICGGIENNTTQDKLYKYNPISKTFTELSFMPQGGRYGHTAINNDGNLLVYGGRNENGEQGQMLSFNPNGNYWNFFDPVGMPPMARENNLSGVLPDEMWIAGGETWSTFKSTQSTNFFTDIWKLDLSQTPAKWIKKSENFIPVTSGAGWISVENNDTLFYSFGGISEITSTGDTTVTNNFYRYNITESIVEQYHEDTENWGNVITSINETDFSQNINLQIYPNPATSEISLTIPNNESIVSIKIYNQNGQLVKQIIKPNAEKINVSDLKTGLYFIRTDTETNRYLSKLIKE